MVRFFKKYDPRVALRTGRGATIPFQDIGEYGLLATSDNYLVGQLETCIREVRGGVQEIDAKEFEELKKKAKRREPLWRESVSRVELHRNQNRVRANAVAAGRASLPFEATGFSENKVLARPVAKSNYVPRTVNR